MIPATSGLRPRPWAVAGLLAAAVAVLLIPAAWPAGGGGFYLDSEGLSRWLPRLQDEPVSLSRLHRLLFETPFPGAPRRVLANLTFLLESHWTGFTPRSARLGNLLLHAVNAGLLFLLLRLALLRTGLPQVKARTAALLAAAPWALNPFQADAVYYIVQRMALLSSTFYLLGAVVYLRAREGGATARWPWWAALAFCYMAGLAAKESAVLMPLGIALLEWLLPPPRRVGPGPSRRTVLGVALALAVAVPALTATALGYDLLAAPGALLEARGRLFTPLTRLLTEGRVLVHYLTLFFLPLPGRLAFVLKYRLSQGLLAPVATLLSWGAVAALIALAVAWRRKRPMVALAILWFFVNHLLESTVLPLEIAYVHRNYLPTALLLLPPAAWLVSSDGLARIGRWRRAAVPAAVVLGTLLALGWWARARVWSEPAAFWRDASVKAPGSLRAFINLGVLADVGGRPEEALAVYRRGERTAFEETPAAWSALHCNIGIAAMNLGRLEEAGRAMEKAVALAPLPDCLLNLAKLRLIEERPDEADAALDRLASLRPRHRKLHLLRARVWLARGRSDLARSELRRELALFPANREAQELLRQLEP